MSEGEQSSDDQHSRDDARDRLDQRRDRAAGRFLLQGDLRIGDAEERPTEKRDRGDRGEDERDPGEDEDRREDPPKPSARDDRRVGSGPRRAHPSQTRERDRRNIGGEEAGAQRSDKRMCLIRAGQQLKSAIPLLRAQRSRRKPLRKLDSVDEALLGA